MKPFFEWHLPTEISNFANVLTENSENKTLFNPDIFREHGGF